MDLAEDEPAFTFLDADDYTSVAIAGTGDGRLYGVGVPPGPPWGVIAAASPTCIPLTPAG